MKGRWNRRGTEGKEGKRGGEIMIVEETRRALIVKYDFHWTNL